MAETLSRHRAAIDAYFAAVHRARPTFEAAIRRCPEFQPPACKQSCPGMAHAPGLAPRPPAKQHPCRPGRMADATDGYTGADVKEVVTLGLKLAFHAGQELSIEHLLEAAPEIRPLSQTDPERVAAMTDWLDRHAKPASRRGEDGRVHKNAARRKRCVAV